MPLWKYVDISEDPSVTSQMQKLWAKLCFQVPQLLTLLKYGHWINPVCSWPSPDCIWICSAEILSPSTIVHHFQNEENTEYRSHRINKNQRSSLLLFLQDCNFSAYTQQSKQVIDSNILWSYLIGIFWYRNIWSKWKNQHWIVLILSNFF